MCSDHLLSAMACLWLSAFSRMSRFCIHILCGSNLPGGAGMRSLTGLPKIHIAGLPDPACFGIGGPLIGRRPSSMMDLTPTSAQQLLWGNATELRQWWMPQSLRNCEVVSEVNSGPPSVASSSGIPNVAKQILSASTTPLAPLPVCRMMSQLEYRSTRTR